MKDDKQGQYYVGELAKHFGVSKDTLRLYDKVGILSPRKESKNGYRVYSREDFICLDFVIRLRKMGLSLEDIRVLINESTIEHAEEVMAIQEEIINKRINEQKYLLSMVIDYKKNFNKVVNQMGTIKIEKSPTFICKSLDVSCLNIMEDFTEIMPAHVPLFTFFCNKDKFISEDYVSDLNNSEKRRDLFQYKLTLIDDEEYVQKKDFPEDRFIILKPQKCVHAIVKNYTNNNYSGTLRLREYIIKNNFNLKGDVMFRAISIRNNSKESVDYYDFWAPIE